MGERGGGWDVGSDKGIPHLYYIARAVPRHEMPAEIEGGTIRAQCRATNSEREWERVATHTIYTHSCMQLTTANCVRRNLCARRNVCVRERFSDRTVGQEGRHREAGMGRRNYGGSIGGGEHLQTERGSGSDMMGRYTTALSPPLPAPPVQWLLRDRAARAAALVLLCWRSWMAV